LHFNRIKWVLAVLLVCTLATTSLAGDTVTVDGVTYEDVIWGRVAHSAVTIYHKTGVATIPLNRLPPELQQRFGYVPSSTPSATNAALAGVSTGGVHGVTTFTANEVAQTTATVGEEDFVPTPLNHQFEWRMGLLIVGFLLYVAGLLSVNRWAELVGAPKRVWNTVAFVLNAPGILLLGVVYFFMQRHRQQAGMPRTQFWWRRFSLRSSLRRHHVEPPLAVLDSDGKPLEIKTDRKTKPIVDKVKSLLVNAIDSRASDMHIEPSDSDVVVRLRVDGEMQPKQSLGRDIGPKVVSSLKTFANVDVADRRKSQDGHFQVNYSGRIVDCRLATSNSIYGENVVLRLLDRSTGVKSLEELGMPPHLLKQFETALAAQGGMILIAGPTGSGKTSTVYAALRRFDPAAHKIMTVEDPVEYELPGAIQIPVNVKAGVTYEEGLKSVMRQDPDVILVGEMRSKEATEVAIRAALTGHLVFSTLHAPSAIGTISRLRDIGIEQYLISSALVAVVSQRLVRRLCKECKEAFTPIGVNASAGGAKQVYYRPRGCPSCDGTGFRGRIGVFEVLLLDTELKKMITAGASEEVMLAHAREQGMTTMQDDIQAKVAAGITTLQEATYSIKS
jgi:type II secretory ATPase GspE/PulE/Tfp pilus assembly ATPase PilB-like protein